MSDIVVVEGTVDEQGRLIVELPPDAPQGEVEVTIRKRLPVTEDALTPEASFDEELEEWLNPENLNGQGLPMGKILQSTAIGIWKDRVDTKDPVAWISEMRRKSRERHIKGG